MQINTTIKAAPYRALQAAQTQDGEGDKQGQKNPPQEGTRSAQILDSLLMSPDFQKKALSNLGPGNSTTITLNGGDTITIRNEGPTALDKLFNSTGRVMANAGQEVVRVMNADPSFTFLASSKAAKEGIEGLVPRGAMGEVEKYMMPALRGVMFASSGMRAVSTFQNKDASTFEKVVDAGHVATNAVGLAGELGKLGAVPGLSGVAPLLSTVGYVGDLVAVSLHAMGYITERGQVNLGGFGLDSLFTSKAAAREAAKAAKEAEQQAQAPQA